MKRPVMALLTLVGVLAASLGAATPAHAYPNDRIHWEYIYVDTGDCSVVAVGSLYLGATKASGGGCNVTNAVMPAPLAHNHFTTDRGGVALYAELLGPSGDTVMTLSFHPYGEHFYICDRANDGDTVYARVKYPHGWTLVAPPGTSKRVECTHRNFAFSEGYNTTISTYDDGALTDYIRQFGLAKA